MKNAEMERLLNLAISDLSHLHTCNTCSHDITTVLEECLGGSEVNICYGCYQYYAESTKLPLLWQWRGRKEFE